MYIFVDKAKVGSEQEYILNTQMTGNGNPGIGTGWGGVGYNVFVIFNKKL